MIFYIKRRGINMNESDMKNLSFETQVIHAGHSFDPATNSLASPLYQTATFGFGTVEDIAEACLYLAEQKYMTGQVLQINGGLYM